MLLDKTGTLTLGQPEVERIVPLGALGRGRGAPARRFGRPDVGSRPRREPRARGGGARARARAARPVCREDPGSGIAGEVEGRSVAVGSSGWLERERLCRSLRPRARGRHRRRMPAGRKILVGVDGALAARDRDGRPASARRRHARARARTTRGSRTSRSSAEIGPRSRTEVAAHRGHRARVRGADAGGEARGRARDPRPARAGGAS